MTKFLPIFIATILIFSINNVSASDNISVPDINNTKISVKIKHLGYDKNFAVEKFRVNMTVSRLGHLTYIEYYYSAGSEVPKFYTSKTHYDVDLIDNKLSFDISRPKTRLGNPYSSIKSIIMLDKKIIAEKWLDNIRSTQFEIGNSSIANTTNLSNKDGIVTTIKPDADNTNTSDIKSDTRRKDNNTNNVSVSKPDAAKRSLMFEMIAIILIGLMIVIIYQNRKNK